MRISEIVWSESDAAHIVRHGVTPEEVEEILAANPVWRKGRTHPETGRVSLIALGRTEAGKYLFVVLSPRELGRARCVTALEMDDKARRFYERHRRK